MTTRLIALERAVKFIREARPLSPDPQDPPRPRDADYIKMIELLERAVGLIRTAQHIETSLRLPNRQ